ncbi:methylated-DNA--[protein]-cysteine S-methyltransferase [Teredinibacter haidensis]|uniref:methylated-DNA--[protein]-cysteine S-methyltransferase n=1 Tax=Teredinibacter haidensis TaxID=2731755 RepID=UPI000948EEFA|nr:bifunctional helix-turn-helix domain-containing protein/methylated-DNA--[protein]-cysteine S-methyltransferase [Teredinibacter haidensis]
MSNQNELNYRRMTKAIQLLQSHFLDQPSTEQIANQLHLSCSQFHTLFRQWTGLTPKQFLQQVTVEQAKQLLGKGNSCLQTSLSLGMSSGSRLYDHMVTLEAVTPGELKSGGKNLDFYFGDGQTPLGRARLIWNNRGIHSLRFEAGNADLAKADFEKSKNQWRHANWHQDNPAAQDQLHSLFSRRKAEKLHLWVSGTNFQVAVWRGLLKIPPGHIQSYGELAEKLGDKNASRAVGQAVGLNPVAVLIPCHRVIQASGALGGYRWGLETKKILLGKELLAHPVQPLETG